MVIIETILALKLHFVETFGYWLIFLATLLESFPIFGLFVPGSLIIFLGAFIAKLGFLNLWLVLAFAIIGAILGDTAGYLFGRYFGKEFIHKYGKYLLIKKEYLEKAGDIVCGHTGKSLVIGRLNPLTRSAAPFVVGAHKISFWKFMFYNVIGGILWGICFTALGYFFGQSYQVAQRYERWILLWGVCVIVLIYLVYFTKLLLQRRAYKKIQKVGECVANWEG